MKKYSATLLSISVRIEDDVAVLEMQGKWRRGPDPNRNILKEAVTDLVQEGRKWFLLNLDQVPYVESIGFTFLLQANEVVSEAKGSLELLKPQPRVLNLLQTLKLDNFFHIHDDEAAAIRCIRDAGAHQSA